jgi:hypothetical protein
MTASKSSSANKLTVPFELRKLFIYLDPLGCTSRLTAVEIDKLPGFPILEVESTSCISMLLVQRQPWLNTSSVYSRPRNSTCHNVILLPGVSPIMPISVELVICSGFLATSHSSLTASCMSNLRYWSLA